MIEIRKIDSIKYMIGLKRHIIKLAPYDKNWSQEFQTEKKRLEKILGSKAVAIEHIGSTAIPNMSAKQIIDILVGVETLKKEGIRCVKLLEEYSLRYKKRTKIRYFVVKGDDSTRTHNIHIARFKGRRWNKLLAFRNYLRSHPRAAKEYNTLKKELEKSYGSKPKLYTEKKLNFVKNILKKALR